MRSYFYDRDGRYVGNKELPNGETIPENATELPVAVKDGQQAHFIDGNWSISDIPEMPIIVPEPTTEDTLTAVVVALAEKGILP